MRISKSSSSYKYLEIGVHSIMKKTILFTSLAVLVTSNHLHSKTLIIDPLLSYEEQSHRQFTIGDGSYQGQFYINNTPLKYCQDFDEKMSTEQEKFEYIIKCTTGKEYAYTNNFEKRKLDKSREHYISYYNSYINNIKQRRNDVTEIELNNILIGNFSPNAYSFDTQSYTIRHLLHNYFDTYSGINDHKEHDNVNRDQAGILFEEFHFNTEDLLRFDGKTLEIEAHIPENIAQEAYEKEHMLIAKIILKRKKQKEYNTKNILSNFIIDKVNIEIIEHNDIIRQFLDKHYFIKPLGSSQYYKRNYFIQNGFDPKTAKNIIYSTNDIKVIDTTREFYKP